MSTDQLGTVYEDISGMKIVRKTRGFSIGLDSEEVVLPKATSFELRPQSPMMVKHIYLGSGDGEDWRCELTFLRPRRVRLFSGEPLCYFYID